jgi:hypothetical protein
MNEGKALCPCYHFEFRFRFIIKAYLANQGQTVRQFQNNLPGRDWMRFLKRHHDVSERFAANIKRPKPPSERGTPR